MLHQISLRSFTPSPRSRLPPSRFVSHTAFQTPGLQSPKTQLKKRNRRSAQRQISFRDSQKLFQDSQKLLELQKQSRQLRLAKQLEWSMSSGTARCGAQPSLHSPPLYSVATPETLATSSPVIKSAVTSNLPTGGAVESASRLAGQGDVLRKAGVAYSVNLALKDTAINSDKFYRMSVVQSIADAKLWGVV
jgi:hypothetical protein